MTDSGGRARRAIRHASLRWPGVARAGRSRVSERRRQPPPLLRQRMPSGRGAMEQPNITSHGSGVLTPRFWIAVILAGVPLTCWAR